MIPAYFILAQQEGFPKVHVYDWPRELLEMKNNIWLFSENKITAKQSFKFMIH